jgi:Arc/MetJ-type ribon-helix-helix transcriptional regulator
MVILLRSKRNPSTSARKIKTSIALDEELLSWVEEMVRKKRFANRTHAIEYALQRIKEQETEELHVKVVAETQT